MYKPDFKKAFNKEKSVLQFFGVYPLIDSKKKFRRFFWYFVNVVNVGLMLMLLLVDDMKSFLDASHFIVISLTFLCKFPLLAMGKGMKLIEDHLDSIDLVNIPEGIINHVKKEELYRNWIYFPQRYLVLGVFFHIIITCVLHQSDRLLFLVSWSPFDLQDYKYYCLTLIFQSVGFLSNGISNGCIDNLYYILIDTVCCQMDILTYSLEHLSNSKGDFALHQELRRNIIVHIQIIRFVKNLQKIYSTIIFFQCLGSVLVICILGFQLSVTVPFPSERFLMQTQYALSMVFQIFCYTWFGQKIKVKSHEVATACYLSKWNEFDFKIRKSLLIVMTRCNRPIILTAGIFDLTLETFTMILRTSYSYMAVLRTMYSEYITE